MRAFQTRLDDELLLVLKSLPDILIQRFSFCTMSYDTRRIKNEEFSYQITDKSNRYKIEKEEIHICEDMKRYQNIAVNIVEFIDTVADAIGEQLIENRFIQLMSIYRSKKSKGELYKHAICKAQIIVSYVKGSTYFT